MERLILRSFQSPGDIVMLTAAVRDLHRAYPNRFVTDVRTSADALWEHNPHITPLNERDRDVRQLDMHYPLIHQSNQRPYHFIHGYPQYLETQLNLRIPVTEFKGDLYLSEAEKNEPPVFGGQQLPEQFWIIVAGGKYDFTAKWWNPDSYQQVVDRLQHRVQFVQCGEAGHWHPKLDGVIDLIGKTDLREFMRLMYHAAGVICPVTFAMHLAAAVPVRSDRPRSRPCVVIAGGREPTHWEAYPQHQYITRVGMLSCCIEGGCWKSRCQKVGDGDAKDRHDLCEQPVEVADDLLIPRCLDMITPAEVVERVELSLSLDSPRPLPSPPGSATTGTRSISPTSKLNRHLATAAYRPEFTLEASGDAEEIVPLAIVCRHLKHYFHDAKIRLSGDSAAEWSQLLNLDGPIEEKHTAATAIRLNGKQHQQHAGPWPNTRAVHWLLSEFRLSPVEDLLHAQLQVNPVQLDQTRSRLVEALGLVSERRQRLPIATLLDDDIPQETLGEIIAVAQRLDCQVIRLQSSSDNGLSLSLQPDGGIHVACPSVSELVAVLAASQAVIGFDSKLLSLASAVQTPAIGLWHNRMPSTVVEPSPHLVHIHSDEFADEAKECATTATIAQNRYKLRSYADLTSVLEDMLNVVTVHTEPRVEQSVDSPAIGTTPIVHDERPDVKEETTVTTAAPASIETSQSVSTQSQTNVRFYHGLGDAANFARLIPMYLKRGHQIGVECTPDKRIIFESAGATIVEHAEHEHHWGYPPHDVHQGHGLDHQGSKLGWNISQAPLPDIGPKDELWSEYCQTQVHVRPQIPARDWKFVETWLQDLPKPVVLLHTKGNTGQSVKSLPDEIAAIFYRELLDRSEGTLILLDWDDRVPRLASYRVRHLTDMSGGCSTERMFALMEQADLMIGVDSGPLHAAGLTSIPRVGIWMPGHYPSRYSLPDPAQLNLVLEGASAQWNRYRRVPWNIVTQGGQRWHADWLAEQCIRMLQPAKYLQPGQLGADVQLQHWIEELCRGDRHQSNRKYTDRNRSFDVLLREATRRFATPTFVETGTIRAEEDWDGAGYSTYLFGNYLRQRQGQLHSVDLTPAHCEFARTWTRVFGETVHVHQADSVGFLKSFSNPIDVLYLDSLDTTEPGHAEHALREVEAALPHLHQESLILFDDTPWSDGAFTGKGAQAVPWLLHRGWTIRYAGYQVLLERGRA